MSCNVLVVDDSALLRTAIKKVVKLAGVPEDRIHDAANGKEALDILETVWVDLVLLDLHMPVMDGEEFLVELRKREALADVAVVIVSTESNAERLARLKELGVQCTLRKPFEPEDLCRIISGVTGAAA
jgi:CheY-like chemotaxis protein